MTAPRCMRLLPHLGLSKVAVGGQDGVLQVFSLKKHEIQFSFKTLPGDPISALQLGGTIGAPQDKIFVASKTEVRGFSKKGKLFLGLDTNMTEHIKSMQVSGIDLMVAGNHLFNHYRNCKDVNSYLSSDNINDLQVMSLDKNHRLVSVLACEDRLLRIIERSAMSQTFPLHSAPVVLSLLGDTGGEGGEGLVVAMENGDIGLVQVNRTMSDWKWLIQNTKKRDSVRCMCWYDLYKDGTKQLIVGRDDGSIQIYGEPLEGMGEAYIEKYNYVCNESITSIQAGTVGNPAFDEIVATTYTGWFFGLTTEVLEKQVNWENNNMNIKMAPEEKQKIEHLRVEIEEIERSLTKERERYQMTTSEDSIGMSTILNLAINDKMTFVKDDYAFILSLETEAPIDNVLLQSDINIKLLDVEKNSAVVSHSYCSPHSGNKLLATYRCQIDTSRLNLNLQYGNEFGMLNVYVTPHVKPKTTHLKTYILRRLGMLTRIHDTVDFVSFHVLRLKGTFTLAEMHSFVSVCLPQVPDKMPTTNKIMYCYESSFSGTQLKCQYIKGEAEFQSDDITIISNLKDFLTQQATRKKTHLEISFELNTECMKRVLSKMYPRMKEELEEQKQALLFEALKDIEQNEGENTMYLTPYCRSIIEKQTKMSANKTLNWNRLERIQEYIMNLLSDWFKFQQVNVKTKLAKLKENLNECTLEDIMTFFENTEYDRSVINSPTV
ncbi:unnamed protein product [Nezara viridula]|uniref:Bardet-Biedl syndrome 7 protein homolog n=1 Tax=Nezara viridula TaxID=85310 RepID=A0A9P0HR61_NEZVI|nr:unnamed protein product [Nezara viridula]